MFNCIFDTSAPLYRDRIYWSSYDEPYKVTDITDIFTDGDVNGVVDLNKLQKKKPLGDSKF